MKGNVVIGQSGGPTAVINASLAGVIKAARVNGAEKIYGMHHGIDGFLKEDLIDIAEYIVEDSDLSLLKRTPSAFLGTCRYKLPKIEGNEAVYDKIFEIMEKYDIQYFFYIGGNDSMDTIKMLSDYAALTGKTQKFVGVPKTVDNDLPITDHTPGYGSAAKFIATAVKEIARDNGSYGKTRPTVCIVEIMGRHAGWLTAAAALARGTDCSSPELIYLPEVPFDMDDFLKRVKELADTKGSITVAVSEGIALADGTFVCELGNSSDYVDAFGHKQLSGCAALLAEKVAEATGYKSRGVELNTLQRCSTHLASRTDIDEAFNCGFSAFKAALAGETGVMVVMKVKEDRDVYTVNYETFDIHQIANVEKKVPMEWITDNGTNVSDEFVKYARPLILGDLHPIYEGGVPKHMTLK